VETDDRQIFGHTKPSLLSGEEDARSHIIAGGEDGRWSVWKREELSCACGTTRNEEIALDYQGWINLDSRLLKRVTIAPIAVLGALITNASLDVANAAMAKLQQMLHGGIGAGAVI